MSRAQQIEERAALWLLRQEEPSWSAADQAELKGWLAESDAHKVAFWRLGTGWREADRIACLGASAQVPSHGLGRMSWWKPLALAASLLLVFTVFLGQGPFGTSQLAPSMQFETAVGGHKLVSLPDGSRVELNTDTAIKAAVGKRGRAVWLERGEAFFDIAKQNGREFVIYAGPRTITVLGTKFSVRRSNGEVIVAVLEGRVRVDRNATASAGDVAIARGRSTLLTNSADAVKQQLAWRSGRLLLEGATLASAVEQFNRYNRKQLVIGDADAAGIFVSGSFLARNVDAFAAVLEGAYGLDVRDSAGRITLSTRRLASRSPLKSRPDLVVPRPKSVLQDAGDSCGSDGCAVIPLSLPAPPVQIASASEKVVRDAKNWNVLHKLYPARALAAREEGMVGFAVKIDSSGSPTSCRITHTSGHPLLDLETCQLIMVHATFKRPAGASISQQRSYEGVVNWKLPTTPQTAAAAPPKPIAPTAAPEEMVCRRVAKTGSNVAFERECMTKSEWQRASSQSRDPWEQLQGRGRGPACEGQAAGPC